MSLFARSFLFLTLAACSQSPARTPHAPPITPDSSAAPLRARPSALVPADVTLPITRSTIDPPSSPLLIVISRTRLALGVDAQALAIPDPATWSTGFDAKYKDGKPRGLLVRPLADALASSNVEISPALIVADASVPYAAFIEVLFTLGNAGANEISIAATGMHGELVAVPVFLPRRGPDGYPVERSSIDLTVQMEDAGYAVHARGASMSPGCRAPSASADAGAPITIPQQHGTYDDAALTACAAALKATSPDDTPIATLVPMRATDIQLVIRAIDALRGDGSTLFPNVGLGLGHH